MHVKPSESLHGSGPVSICSYPSPAGFLRGYEITSFTQFVNSIFTFFYFIEGLDVLVLSGHLFLPFHGIMLLLNKCGVVTGEREGEGTF